MTRFIPFALLAGFTACSDSAQVLVGPDSTAPEAGVDAPVDVSADTSVQSDASDDGDAAADADLDADAGCATGFELCNGTCVDVTTYQSDAKNCGFCAHDCLGNVCTSGLCAVDTIGTNLANPSTLAVDGTNVYFTTLGDSSPTAGSVYECPVTGCPSLLTPMTTSLNNPETIAVDATTVYWDNTADLSKATGSVMSCPIAGCGTKNANRKTLASGIQFVLGLAVDSKNVYFGVWGPAPFYTKGSIDTCPLTGCTGAPPAVITGQAKPLFVALDTGVVYMAVAGGGAGIPYVQSGPIPGPTTGTRLYTGSAIYDQIGGFGIYGSLFYFADSFANTIEFCPLAGCPPIVPVFAKGVGAPFSLAVDAKGVYWADNTGIEFCPRSGCGASGPRLLATSANSIQNIAINGSFVYWVEDDNIGTAGQVLRVPR